MPNDATHGVMFHHFHGGAHTPGQGSISAEAFGEMLDYLQNNYRLLSAGDYLERITSGKIAAEEICLTFDDALLCQYDIAAPILKQRQLTAFFFIYSAPLCGEMNTLEIYRAFRTRAFTNIDDFYHAFFAEAQEKHRDAVDAARKRYPTNYLEAFPFYSANDKWFRYLRDQGLNTQYDPLMQSLMQRMQFDMRNAAKNLWMTDDHVRALAAEGHLIGLHSYSHPTVIETLPEQAQQQEYRKNFEHLTHVLGYPPRSMSHPCGHYTDGILDFLKSLGITLGFRSNLERSYVASNLEVPRKDHAVLQTEMQDYLKR